MFQYLELLQRVGARQAIYDEIKLISDNEFRWIEQVRTHLLLVWPCCKYLEWIAHQLIDKYSLHGLAIIIRKDFRIDSFTITAYQSMAFQ